MQYSRVEQFVCIWNQKLLCRPFWMIRNCPLLSIKGATRICFTVESNCMHDLRNLQKDLQLHGYAILANYMWQLWLLSELKLALCWSGICVGIFNFKRQFLFFFAIQRIIVLHKVNSSTTSACENYIKIHCHMPDLVAFWWFFFFLFVNEYMNEILGARTVRFGDQNEIKEKERINKSRELQENLSWATICISVVEASVWISF